MTSTNNQPDYTRLRPILDTWLHEWGIHEQWYAETITDNRTLDEHQAIHTTIQHHLAQHNINADNRDLTRSVIQTKLTAYLSDHAITLSETDQHTLCDNLVGELIGLGPLDTLLADPEIHDITVQGPHTIRVSKNQRPIATVDLHFENTNHLVRIINRIFIPLGKRISWHDPVGQARTPDGLLACAVVPPVAITAPVLTIRKLTHDWITFDDLIRFQSISPDMADFLTACMQTRLNVIISGGLNSGKMSIFNILTSFIPDYRTILVEHTAHLQVRNQNIIALEARPPLNAYTNQQETNFTVVDLLQTATWMNPDRILVGELQGPEILDVLRLMDRGYTIMTIINAESHQNALDRLEMLVKFYNPELPAPYLRTFIGSAVDIIVQTNRLLDGSRKITSIVEVQPERTGDYTIQPIFTFQQTGTNEQGKITGEFRSPFTSEQRTQRLRDHRLFRPDTVA